MAKERSVLLTRYFTFVGGILLALILVADWYWQNPPPMPSYGPSPIDETILRIRSAHKWPQKIVLDTTAPIDARPSPTAMTEIAIPSAPGPAMKALAQANAPQTAKRKSSARARNKYPRRGVPVRFAVNPMPSAWPAAW